jgi:hypothetical protein
MEGSLSQLILAFKLLLVLYAACEEKHHAKLRCSFGPLMEMIKQKLYELENEKRDKSMITMLGKRRKGQNYETMQRKYVQRLWSQQY